MAAGKSSERTPVNELRTSVDHAQAFREDLAKFFRIHFGSHEPTRREKLRAALASPGLHCVAIYRFERHVRALARKRSLAGLALLNMARGLRVAMGLIHHVEIDAEIGPGLYIGHASSIFIGPTRIGRNFSVTHNVTVGVGHNAGAPGLPTIGDDVWVGTASVLSGKIHIGSRVTVANGTMLSRDAPDGALVGGNPGRVVVSDYENQGLFGGPGPVGPRERPVNTVVP